MVGQIYGVPFVEHHLWWLADRTSRMVAAGRGTMGRPAIAPEWCRPAGGGCVVVYSRSRDGTTRCGGWPGERRNEEETERCDGHRIFFAFPWALNVQIVFTMGF